jgi:hypothetical protein
MKTLTQVGRVLFVAGDYTTATTVCPWARVVQRTGCGHLCFESLFDYHNWLEETV